MTFMNKQRGAHMGHKEEPVTSHHGSDKEPNQDHGGEAPDIMIKSHAKGHTVTIMHHDGRSESHEHSKGDTEGIKAHIDQHIGGAPGQDHGGSSGSNEEDEYGLGSGV